MSLRLYEVAKEYCPFVPLSVNALLTRYELFLKDKSLPVTCQIFIKLLADLEKKSFFVTLVAA